MIAAYIRLPKKPFWSSVLIVVAISILSNIVIDEMLKTMLASVQSALTLIVLHYVATMFLFRKYKNIGIQQVMMNRVVLAIRWFLFFAITVFLFYGLYFFVLKSWDAFS